MKLTIIIPAYNEINTLETLVNKVIASSSYEKEIILVDDGSNDGTTQLIREKIENKVNKVIYHKQNSGKGSAIKSAIKEVNGDIIIIQDADLEYDPNDYDNLVRPIIVSGDQFIQCDPNLNTLSKLTQ